MESAKLDRVLDRLVQSVLVPRTFLEDLLLDLDRAKVLREYLQWQRSVAMDRLCKVEDPQGLVRWQAKVDGFERSIATLDNIVETLISEGVAND